MFELFVDPTDGHGEVIPTDDIFEHEPGMNCKCSPIKEERDLGYLIVHKAYDQGFYDQKPN